MSDPVITLIVASLAILGLLLLATMTAVIGLMDRVKELEAKTAVDDLEPVHTLIVESQEQLTRFIERDIERRTSADE